jgi:hypothetical protein
MAAIQPGDLAGCRRPRTLCAHEPPQQLALDVKLLFPDVLASRMPSKPAFDPLST